jgi:translation initiation factor IF-2
MYAAASAAAAAAAATAAAAAAAAAASPPLPVPSFQPVTRPFGPFLDRLAASWLAPVPTEPQIYTPSFAPAPPPPAWPSRPPAPPPAGAFQIPGLPQPAGYPFGPGPFTSPPAPAAALAQLLLSAPRADVAALLGRGGPGSGAGAAGPGPAVQPSWPASQWPLRVGPP